MKDLINAHIVPMHHQILTNLNVISEFIQVNFNVYNYYVKVKIFSGEKPYVCDVCHQRFTQSNSLKAHRLIHTGNKPVFKV